MHTKLDLWFCWNMKDQIRSYKTMLDVCFQIKLNTVMLQDLICIPILQLWMAQYLWFVLLRIITYHLFSDRPSCSDKKHNIILMGVDLKLPQTTQIVLHYFVEAIRVSTAGRICFIFIYLFIYLFICKTRKTQSWNHESASDNYMVKHFLHIWGIKNSNVFFRKLINHPKH